MTEPYHATSACITLAGASKIVEVALRHGRELSLPPLTAAVLDSAGRLVALKREDGSSLLRPDIAQAKAFGALAMGTGSRALAERAQSHPAFINAVTALAGGNLVPVPGGVLIFDAQGHLLGAAGMSGALPDQDEACVMAGIAACGLIAETGSPHH